MIKSLVNFSFVASTINLLFDSHISRYAISALTSLITSATHIINEKYVNHNNKLFNSPEYSELNEILNNRANLIKSNQFCSTPSAPPQDQKEETNYQYQDLCQNNGMAR